MKKVLSILLVLLLALSILPAAAFAEGPAVVLSPQNLRVNGVKINCEKYNIDNSNYFKLRDIALVLSGTGSEFSVNWDGEKKCISIVTGEAYEPNGSELDLSGGDKSETAIVISRRFTWPVEWLTEEYIYNQDGAALSHSVITYSEDGYQLTYLYEGPYGSDSYQYTYDDLGRMLMRVEDNVSTSDSGDSWEDHSTTTYEYDIWGNLAREVYQATGDVVTETNYTYDDNANLLISETLNNAGSSAIYYTYDENGYQTKVTYTYDDVVESVEEYFRDENGTIIGQKSSSGDGEVYSTAEFTVVDGQVVQETITYGEEVYTYSYSYDENGNMTHIETQDPYGTTITDRIYDEEGREVQEETTYDGGSSLTVSTYDERGLLVKYERTDSDGYYAVDEYTYDEEGNALTEVYKMEGLTRTTTYTYDRQARKMTSLTVLEYTAVG